MSKYTFSNKTSRKEKNKFYNAMIELRAKLNSETSEELQQKYWLDLNLFNRESILSIKKCLVVMTDFHNTKTRRVLYTWTNWPEGRLACLKNTDFIIYNDRFITNQLEKNISVVLNLLP